MLKTSNRKKQEQLGMPWGTASARLKKMIMFHLLQKHGENICHKCSNPIQKHNDLSIEHKQPWLYIDTKLFWDIDNIAFSHIWCNKPDRYRKDINYDKRIIPPAGMNWCNRHKEFFPKEMFSSNKNHWTGKHTLCKQCQHYNIHNQI